MDYIFIGIIVFLLILAIFDLAAGVSNDAANFLNSAIGARAASFKTIVTIASVGIFVGALTSNGMIEVVRNGIFRPENFTFYDVICIFMAVMVADVILLDIFNSLGMPTSTTVSMVFEILGAAFAVSLFKLTSNPNISLGQLLNTEKAFEVIIAIFLSVIIAFIFGTLVQYLARLWFSFDYKKGLSWKIGIFGGICCTGIIYFLLIKGIKDMSFMTAEYKLWIDTHTLMIVGICLVGFTLLMQLLHTLGVNVFKVIVLLGTFALAMAFAGNDLVNFIGVPVTGFASFQDYAAHGAGNADEYLMTSLNTPGTIPIYFLVGAGAIMIAALVMSKKVRKVVNTSVNLARQDAGEEMFGSSKLARACVRTTINISKWVVAHTPERVRRWTDSRLNTDEAIIENGAAFDLIRGSINLVLAGMLIALGTSMKLPLSTTYVTFMVAMGSSLADRAWGRESAVFRITGVISVIGGWFITAGAAFIGTALIVSIMHIGGVAAIVITSIIAIVMIIHNNFIKKERPSSEDNDLYDRIITAESSDESWRLLQQYMMYNQQRFFDFAITTQKDVSEGFVTDNAKTLKKAVSSLNDYRQTLKNLRRKFTICFKHVDPTIAIEMSTWFHLAINCQIEIVFNMLRIAETTYEHVDNNFRPLPEAYTDTERQLSEKVNEILRESKAALISPQQNEIIRLRHKCDVIRGELSAATHTVFSQIRQGDDRDMGSMYIYVNMLQESQEIVSILRKLLRADAKLVISPETPIRSIIPAE